jgi:hypothetical protein
VAPARKRDYSAEHARRKELAAQRGFGKSGKDALYEQRIKGGAKRAKPSDRMPSGPELAKRRGHSKFGAFLRAVQPESLIAVGANLGTIDRTENGWDDIPVIIYTPDGEEIEFSFDHMTEAELDWLLAELDAIDVDYSPDYDLKALAPA